MSDNTSHIRGFRPFISLWYDATDQILTETDPSRLDNDIKLFEILRNVVLAPEKPVFIQSYKLNDFNRVLDIQNHIKYPNKNTRHLTWVPTRQPSLYGRIPQHIKVKPNIPSMISYCSIRNTQMLAKSNQITIRNNCMFKQDGIFTQPAHKIYTIINNTDFLAEVDDGYVLYPVSERIMDMIAHNDRNRINLQTFQELTAKMHTKLQEQQNKNTK